MRYVAVLTPPQREPLFLAAVLHNRFYNVPGGGKPRHHRKNHNIPTSDAQVDFLVSLVAVVTVIAHYPVVFAVLAKTPGVRKASFALLTLDGFREFLAAFDEAIVALLTLARRCRRRILFKAVIIVGVEFVLAVADGIRVLSSVLERPRRGGLGARHAEFVFLWLWPGLCGRRMCLQGAGATLTRPHFIVFQSLMHGQANTYLCRTRPKRS